MQFKDILIQKITIKKWHIFSHLSLLDHRTWIRWIYQIPKWFKWCLVQYNYQEDEMINISKTSFTFYFMKILHFFTYFWNHLAFIMRIFAIKWLCGTIKATSYQNITKIVSIVFVKHGGKIYLVLQELFSSLFSDNLDTKLIQKTKKTFFS